MELTEHVRLCVRSSKINDEESQDNKEKAKSSNISVNYPLSVTNGNQTFDNIEMLTDFNYFAFLSYQKGTMSLSNEWVRVPFGSSLLIHSARLTNFEHVLWNDFEF